MAIPPELQQIVSQAKQQYPQLAHLPDEVVAQMLLQALQEEQLASSARDQNLENVTARRLVLIAQERDGSLIRDTG